MIAVTVGVVIAGLLVAYGFSRSDDDRGPAVTTPATIGVIKSPAVVLTTQPVANPGGSSPATADVPVVPTDTVDIAVPPTVAATP
jgi:hypothetical protein